jgi:hypothetical protein
MVAIHSRCGSTEKEDDEEELLQEVWRRQAMT